MNRITFPLFAFLFFSKMLAAQVDTVPPVIACKNLIWINIPATNPCAVTVWSSDFIDSVKDDSQLPVEIGIRKACTGSGFPENKTNLSFNISEWGEAKVEVWARDAAGNTSSCIVLVKVYHSGDCDISTIAIFFKTQTQQNIEGVAVNFEGGNCLGDSLNFAPWMLSDWDGFWIFYGGGGGPTPGFTTHITPYKNTNPLNGVTTYDLLLISKHILGIEPFDSPFKIIAADANQDGKVTTFDIITLRKLILGITDELPNGKSWRFVPVDFSFFNPANPFQTPFPERIEIPNTADPVPSVFGFKGVKIGDVNFSADPKQ